VANWSNPTVTSLYLDLLADLKARDVDALTLLVTAGSNLPTGAIKYDRPSNVFQEWSGSAWNNKVLAVAGGGTGATTPSAAQGALGLGNMAVQNANAVSISGGIINSLTGFTVSVDILPTSDNVRAIGSAAQRFHRIYLGSGCVLPVGTNKYVTG